MTADELVALFDLEPSGKDRFVGHSPHNGWKRVFGGQVLAQALVAAERTVVGRDPHSLHAYFLLGRRSARADPFRSRASERRAQFHDSADRRPAEGRGDLRHDGLVPCPGARLRACRSHAQGAAARGVPGSAEGRRTSRGPRPFPHEGNAGHDVADRLPPDRSRPLRARRPARAPPDPVDADRRTLAGRPGAAPRGASLSVRHVDAGDSASARTGARSTTTASRSRASTMPCGFIGPAAPTTGCSMFRTAPTRAARPASCADSCTLATAR